MTKNYNEHNLNSTLSYEYGLFGQTDMENHTKVAVKTRNCPNTTTGMATDRVSSTDIFLFISERTQD